MKIEVIALFERTTKNNHCYRVTEPNGLVPFIQSVYIVKSAIPGDPVATRVVLTVEVQTK